MTPKDIFALLAILVSLLGSVPYVLGMIRGTTKPHMISWLIWAVVCATGGAGQLQAGGGAGSWYLVFNAAYCFGICVASFWRGTKDIKRSDWVVLAVALSAMPLGYVTDTPLVAVLIAVAIDALAYIPTIRKSWNRPQEEAAVTWALTSAVFILSILALETYNVTTWIYPATFTAINIGLTAFLLTRRKMLGMRFREGG